MNAMGTQLRDLINSGLTRWRMAVLNKCIDAAAELGKNPVSKHQIQPEYGDEQGTAELVSRDQIFRRKPGQGKNIFPCSADHEQDWQTYLVDPYSCYMCDQTYIIVTTRSSNQQGFRSRQNPCKV